MRKWEKKEGGNGWKWEWMEVGSRNAEVGSGKRKKVGSWEGEKVRKTSEVGRRKSEVGKKEGGKGKRSRVS